MNKSLSSLYIIIIIYGFGVCVDAFGGDQNTSTQELSYTEFLQRLKAGEIKSVEIDKDSSSLIAHPKTQPKAEKVPSKAVKTFYGEQKSADKFNTKF